jgi:hypothetical protein
MSFFRHAIPTTSTIIKNLIGWWKLGDSQTSAKSSFNNNNITLTNSPTINLNNSLSFNGSTQYGSVAIDLSLYNKITLCFWLNVTSYLGSASRVGLEYSENFNFSDGFAVFIDNTNSTIHASMHSVTNASYQLQPYTRMPFNETHFYSIIFDRTTGTNQGIFLYIDGNLQTPTDFPAPIFGNLGTSTFGNSNILYLMARGNSGGSPGLFGSGALNDLRIYSGSLTQEEIKILYNLGPK